MSYPQTMNREVFHEGWLIKSPPTKRIWRARWRRRWFTLKQGEIPGQYCLEYYTDRSCRKLKGIIDLDQCEQVDCGLRLEHRKQKFQYMFDVKTPRRTFYLAAESEVDMHDWVNCICQVCNLQDLTKQQACDRQYYNVGNEALANKPVEAAAAAPSTSTHTSGPAAGVSGTAYQNDEHFVRAAAASAGTEYSNRETIMCADAPTSSANVVAFDARTDYYNFSSVATELDTSSSTQFERSQSMSVPNKSAANTSATGGGQFSLTGPTAPPAPPRPRSLADPQRTTTRRIPDNLKLTDTMLGIGAVVGGAPQPPCDDLSPALSTASGPYIAISECFTGGSLPGEHDPTTPLNSLDPRFYDMPRSRHTIGLNLIDEPQQQYSPKRSNVTPSKATAVGLQSGLATTVPPKSGRSSPSDSESVFTDDEEWPAPANCTLMQSTAASAAATTKSTAVSTGGNDAKTQRSLRPSDSSVENDSMAYTYTQRFSKMPNGGAVGGAGECSAGVEVATLTGAGATSMVAAAAVLGVVEPWIEASAFGSAEALEADDVCNNNDDDEDDDDDDNNNEDGNSKELASGQQCQMSDTENASPAIGPKDMNSCVDENYDIPRSHHYPYYRLKALHSPGAASTTSSASGAVNKMTTSTPNLLADAAGRQRHFYTNAAPTNLEGNVFRYDFVEQENAPLVNRGLKPKPIADDQRAAVASLSSPLRPTSARRNIHPPGVPTQHHHLGGAAALAVVKPPQSAMTSPPPSINRKLKPNAAADVAGAGGSASPLPPSTYASQTLPRNYNHSAARQQFGHIRSNSTALSLSTGITGVGASPAVSTLQPMLDYLELDTSAGGGVVSASPGKGADAIGGFSKATRSKGIAVTSSSSATGAAGTAALSGSTASAASGSESSIVYKSVDFIKTEAIKRTRQDRAHKTSNGGD